MLMKKIAIILLLMSTFGISNKATAQVAFQNKQVTITRFEDNMWVIETDDKTTLYLVEGTEKALLIDTGTKIKNLDSIIRQLTQKPLMVVITHAHHDHAGNIGYFKEIWMHPGDTVLLNKNYKGKVNYVKEGDIFDLGQTLIEVSYMPGHTPGSIVLLDRKAGNCYSGDAFGSNHAWLQLKPLSPMETYLNSCIKMEQLMDSGITKIYCGHYPYAKKVFDKSYIVSMHQLAEGLINGTDLKAEPYAQKIGCPNPMSVTLGEATIVYDPDYLNKK
jgi:hydroxyacylglutathione hydrolase